METVIVIPEDTSGVAPVWDEHALDELREIGGQELVKRVVRQSMKDAEDRIIELQELRPEAPPSRAKRYARLRRRRRPPGRTNGPGSSNLR